MINTQTPTQPGALLLSRVAAISSLTTASELSAAIAAAPSAAALQGLAASAANTPHQAWLVQQYKVRVQCTCTCTATCNNSRYIAASLRCSQPSKTTPPLCLNCLHLPLRVFVSACPATPLSSSQVQLLPRLEEESPASLVKSLWFFARLGPGHAEMFERVSSYMQLVGHAAGRWMWLLCQAS